MLSEPDGRSILELDDVTVSADGRATPILDGVSCTLRAKEILGVVGETAAGKTTDHADFQGLQLLLAPVQAAFADADA